MAQAQMFLLAFVAIVALQVHADPVISDLLPNENNKNSSYGSFLVLDSGKEIFIPNLQRSIDPSLLKLSINGLTVKSVTALKANEWKWKLNNDYEVVFSMSKTDDLKVTKYTIQVPGSVANPQVCFHYGYRNASWFNAYESLAPSWPMNTSRSLPAEDFNNIRNYQFDTVHEDFYTILEPLFFNSDGFAVTFDQYQPLFFRRDPNHNGGHEPVLCFWTNNSAPYNAKVHDQNYKNMKIFIFAADNIRTVTDYVINKSGLIPKPTSIPDTSKFFYPTFSDYTQRSSNWVPDIDKFANDIIYHGFPNRSTILHGDHFQKDLGEYILGKVDPGSAAAIAKVHAKGFKVSLAVMPRTHQFRKSLQHADNLTADLFLKAVTDNSSTILLDFSNPEACSWFEYKLNALKFEQRYDSFQLNTVPITWMLNMYDSEVQKYPAQLTKRYAESGAKLGNKVSIDFGYKTQHLPNFVRFTHQKDLPSSEFPQLLKNLIPNVLAVSIAGYSFIEPYQIGGFSRYFKASEELYIRWVQAVTFMPSMAFLYPPWEYGIYKNGTTVYSAVLNITRKFVQLHEEHAPLLVELAKQRITSGSPIIRPLWYVAPEDVSTYHINDQFMVGNDILVAPVLGEKVNSRKIYLPTGIWIDQNGFKHIGPIWITSKVPLDVLPYFKRQIR